MCGIFFSCSLDKHRTPSDSLRANLSRRGPDNISTVLRSVTLGTVASPDLFPKWHNKVQCLTFVTTVLSLRGDSIVSQPLEDQSSGSLFCWNGEAWKIDDHVVQGNDAKPVFDLLLNATRPNPLIVNGRPASYEQSLRNFVNALSSVTGPFAFLFYDAPHQRVFYGRDVLGRRSLLIKRSSINFDLSSISGSTDTENWSEVEADGLYLLDLTKCPESSALALDRITCIPWVTGKPKCELTYALQSPFPNINIDVGNQPGNFLKLDSPIVSDLFQRLHASLALRTQDIRLQPSKESLSTHIGILFSGGLDCTLLACIMHSILPLKQEIDLLNVAFENPRVVQAAAASYIQSHQSAPSAYSICPDRITGHSSYEELLRICPGRTWRFVSIDVAYIETKVHRSQIVSLMNPHNTEMDLSIACALYFAARGSGMAQLNDDALAVSYSTPARVLISGLGADELFGGYTRHATAFNARGYPGLVSELELDFTRLGKRNLGRDDRVISHWGKEVRYPYLDENLVSWALGLPVWQKCGFGQLDAEDEMQIFQKLEPGKRLLRLLAWRLGLRGAAVEKKRAIQFGARTAKMEFGKSKGTQILSQD